MPLRDVDEQRVACNAMTAIAAEGPVGDESYAVIATIRSDTVTEVLVIERVELDLHSRDVDDGLRGFDLTDIDVAETDVTHLAIALQIGECANAGFEWRARVGHMKQVEIDRVDVECAPARVTGGTQV